MLLILINGVFVKNKIYLSISFATPFICAGAMENPTKPKQKKRNESVTAHPTQSNYFNIHISPADIQPEELSQSYKCQYPDCNLRFTNSSRYKTHQYVHLARSCSTCKIAFKTVEAVHRHKQSHLTDLPIQSIDNGANNLIFPFLEE